MLWRLIAKFPLLDHCARAPELVRLPAHDPYKVVVIARYQPCAHHLLPSVPTSARSVARESHCGRHVALARTASGDSLHYSLDSGSECSIDACG